MVPMLGNEGSSRILKTISPLLIHATTEVRLAICDILDALSESDPSVLNVVIIQSLPALFFFIIIC